MFLKVTMKKASSKVAGDGKPSATDQVFYATAITRGAGVISWSQDRKRAYNCVDLERTNLFSYYSQRPGVLGGVLAWEDPKTGEVVDFNSPEKPKERAKHVRKPELDAGKKTVEAGPPVDGGRASSGSDVQQPAVDIANASGVGSGDGGSSPGIASITV